MLYAEHHRFDIDLTLRVLAQRAPHLRFEVVSGADEVLARLPSGPRQPCRYDVVLLDYVLPGMNALDIATTIGSIEPSIA